MNVIPDSFDFKQYVSASKSHSDVVRVNKLDLVDAFYGTRMQGDTLPWPKTHETVAFRPGEVTLWPGISGHGKSLVTTQVAFHLAMVGLKVGIVSLEMRPVITMARMARMVSGTDKPTPEWLEGFKRWSDDKVFLMGTQGIVNPSRILDFCRFAAQKLGVTHVFVDNLTKIIRDETDAAQQKTFVDDLTTIARDCRVHIHLVVHTRKTESEYSMPDKFDVRGSSAIVDQADNVISVFRHKKKEEALLDTKMDPVKRADWEARPDTILIVSKQRNGDWEGKIGLYVHRASMWFNERPKQAHPLPHLFDLKAEEPEDVPF